MLNAPAAHKRLTLLLPACLVMKDVQILLKHRNTGGRDETLLHAIAPFGLRLSPLLEVNGSKVDIDSLHLRVLLEGLNPLHVHPHHAHPACNSSKQLHKIHILSTYHLHAYNFNLQTTKCTSYIAQHTELKDTSHPHRQNLWLLACLLLGSTFTRKGAL